MDVHVFGPWGPPRFIPLPPLLRRGLPPAVWLTVTRVCRGGHDVLCAEAQTQVFGPLVLPEESGGLWQCPRCLREQAPAEGVQLCLACADTAVAQVPSPARSVSAVAALQGASGMLRQARTDPAAWPLLLEGTGDLLGALLEAGAQSLRQDPRRAGHSGSAALVLLARQLLANAEKYAAAHGPTLEEWERDGRTGKS